MRTLQAIGVALLIIGGLGGSAPRASAAGNPLAGRAMWIWDLQSADNGHLGSLIAEARAYGVGTLLIKSSDGTDPWPQFSPGLVDALHASGLRVCAWQYVYGDHPVTEAYLGYYAVRDGADCLIVDAESEYQGKYVAAQTYITRLRRLIGAGYPLGLAGLPYVDYHPGFPYSVFLGPDGAQFNVPQMYWAAIGVTTDAVFAHTYAFNLIFGRPIYPLGQVFGDPPAHQVFRFRELAQTYGAPGLSWWDWPQATRPEWIALSRPAGALTGYVPDTTLAELGYGAQGDIVVWAQEHLISAGFGLGVNGNFGSETLADVKIFQADHGLAVDGIIGPETWRALLAYRPASIIWVHRGYPTVATIAQRRRGALVMPVPASASLPARGTDLPASLGAGSP